MKNKLNTIIDKLKNWIDYEENHKDAIDNYLSCLEFDYQNIKLHLQNDLKYNETEAENLAWFVHEHKYEIENLNSFCYRKEYMLAANMPEENEILLLSAPIGEIEYQFDDNEIEILKKYKDEIELKAWVSISDDYKYAYYSTDVIHSWYADLNEIIKLKKDLLNG